MPSLEFKNFVPELQSVRGIAAVTVMIGHSLNYYAAPSWFHHLSLIFNGRAAVVVFFVLSGYVLTSSLVRSDLTRKVILTYYIRRFFRIYPAIWFASALGLLYIYFLQYNIHVGNQSDGVLSQFKIERFNFIFVTASFLGLSAFILPQLWSITIEIFASLLLPLVAFTIVNSKRLFFTLLIISIFISFLFWDKTYYNVALYFMDFFAGASLTILSNSKIFEHNVKSFGVYILSASSLLIFFTQFIPLPYYSPVSHLIETFLACMIISMAAANRSKMGFLSHSYAIKLGDISYSLYLLHYVVLCVIAKMLALLKLDGLLTIGNPIYLAIFIACLTAIFTIPLSLLSYRYIELPGISTGKALCRFAENRLIVARTSISLET